MIILIQILIKYNAIQISLLHAPDYKCTWFWPLNLENLPTVGGETPPPTPSPRSVALLPRAWSLRSFAFVLKIFSVFFLKSEIICPLLKTCLRHCLIDKLFFSSKSVCTDTCSKQKKIMKRNSGLRVCFLFLNWGHVSLGPVHHPCQSLSEKHPKRGWSDGIPTCSSLNTIRVNHFLKSTLNEDEATVYPHAALWTLVISTTPRVRTGVSPRKFPTLSCADRPRTCPGDLWIWYPFFIFSCFRYP